MTFTVRVFLGDREIKPEELKDITINSPVVDTIINNVIERTYEVQDAES